MPYYSITSNTNDISAGVKKRFSPHRDRKHKQKKMDTSQTIQTKIKMMTQKRKSQNTKKIIIQKRREKTASNNRKKRFVVQKKYNAYLSHLSIMDYERVGLWICAFRGVQKEK